MEPIRITDATQRVLARYLPESVRVEGQDAVIRCRITEPRQVAGAQGPFLVVQEADSPAVTETQVELEVPMMGEDAGEEILAPLMCFHAEFVSAAQDSPTDDELVHHFNMAPETIRALKAECVRRGLLRTE